MITDGLRALYTPVADTPRTQAPVVSDMAKADLDAATPWSRPSRTLLVTRLVAVTGLVTTWAAR